MQHPRTQGVVKATPIGARFRDVFSRDARSQPALSTHMDSIYADDIPSSSLIPSSAPRKRGRAAAFAIPDRSPALPAASRASAARGHVEATPGRPSALKYSDFLAPPESEDDAILASSPVMSRKISQPRFVVPPRRPLVPHADSGIGMPSSPTSCVGGAFSSSGSGTLAETPRKPRSAPPSGRSLPEAGIIAATPAKARAGPVASVAVDVAQTDMISSGVASGESARRPSTIYERLGWDDDLDELG